MPGVIRPYTLTDILATINNQNGQSASGTTGAATVTFGIIAEADESIPGTSIADSATTTSAVSAGWDQTVWGATSWS